MQALGDIYLSLLLLATVVSIGLTWTAWMRRMQPGALPLFQLGITLAILCISSAIESLTPTLAAKEIWVNVQYLGYATSPVFYFMLVMQYLGMKRWTAPHRQAILLLIPLVTIILAWTNNQHHLMRSQVHLEVIGQLAFLGKTCGPWWWVHLNYSFLLMVTSIIFLLTPRLYTHQFYRLQTQALMIGLLIPIISSVLYVCKISISPSMDLTPACAAFSCLLIGWSVLRYRMFEIMPVARDQVVESMSDGMLVLDRQLRIIDLNEACHTMLSLHPDAVLGQPVQTILADQPVLLDVLTGNVLDQAIEVAIRIGEEERFWAVRLSSLSYTSKHPLGRLALFHDITERKRAEQQIEHMAFHDRLTDLPNFNLFQQHLHSEIAHARRHQLPLALLILDLNEFKAVNDTYGHHYGDIVLREVADRLRTVVRESDALCRLGGDEFVVLLPEVTGYGGAKALAARITETLAQPLRIDHVIFRMSVSIGISLYPDDGTTEEELLRRADSEMYAEKRRQKADRVRVPVEKAHMRE